MQSIALDLFEQRGYDRVSVADIARGAEVAERTIYRHFGTKERLVLLDELDEMAGAQIARLAADRDLREATRLAVRGLRQSPEVTPQQWADSFRRLRLIYREPALRAAMASAMDTLTAELARAVAVERGLARDDRPTHAGVAAVFASLEVACQGALDEATPEALEREILLCLDALDRF
ncbi:helix-turn-helix transcriptional regulator [Microbacterium sp. NEAU-LLC]|uniref:Helix-turn-helix transcriptional regulator n=1 Tax=Microbacterium helvum TaxID=2773713 RepID=A0ABR8NL49_9MICO|nr:TetR family transcriptional regulator [Microbacterium helvum]MBD3941123.1 helix-turn-helix transcriptional regulator [Microbacterium helvum]